MSLQLAKRLYKLPLPKELILHLMKNTSFVKVGNKLLIKNSMLEEFKNQDLENSLKIFILNFLK